jgi:hypothetical protein
LTLGALLDIILLSVIVDAIGGQWWLVLLKHFSQY